MGSFAKCIEKPVLVDRSHVCGGGVLVVFVKSGFMSGDSRPTLKNYDRAADKITDVAD